MPNVEGKWKSAQHQNADVMWHCDHNVDLTCTSFTVLMTEFYAFLMERPRRNVCQCVMLSMVLKQFRSVFHSQFYVVLTVLLP